VSRAHAKLIHQVADVGELSLTLRDVESVGDIVSLRCHRVEAAQYLREGRPWKILRLPHSSVI